jgi:hypothetical protein
VRPHGPVGRCGTMAGTDLRQQHSGPVCRESGPGGRGKRHTSAHDRQASRPLARPDSNPPPVNGEQVRDTRFWLPPHSEIAGYDARQVDGLVHRVAAELDAGRSARPLIEKATFRRRLYRWRYDIDAVDWFLGQLLLPPGHVELAGVSADPWRDLAVAQLVRGGVSGPAGFYPHDDRYRPASDSVSRPRRDGARTYLAEQCEDAWRDFGHVPGTYLWWGKVGRALSELRTAERQTLASERGSGSEATVSMGGRSLAFRAVGKDGSRFTFEDTPAEPPNPGVAEFYARVCQDAFGHFTKTLDGRTRPIWVRFRAAELTDETGIPVLYLSGSNFKWRAYCSIMFADHRRLRFLVRGTRRENAIMTAVDQAGNRVARYRIIDKRSTEITVNPGWKLTDELTLAIAVSASQLDSYFERPDRF